MSEQDAQEGKGIRVLPVNAASSTSDEYAQIRRERALLGTIYEISRQISACGLDSIRDLGDILEPITTLAVKSAQAEDGTLFIVDEKGRVQTWRNIGLPALAEGEVAEIVRTGFAGWVIRENRSDIITDLRSDRRWVVLPDRRWEGSAIGVPLACGEQILGALVLNHSHRDFFLKEHLELLEAIAAQAAIVITKVAIHQKTRRQATLMGSLAQTSWELSSTLDHHQQLQSAWEFARDQLGAPAFFIALYDEDLDLLRFEVAYDGQQPIVVKDRPLTSKEKWGISGYVVKSGQEFFCLTAEERDQRLREIGLEAISIGNSCATGLVLPLKIGRKTIGVISIQSEQPHAWDEVAQDAFRALASQVAVAVRNAQLFQQAKGGQAYIRSLYEASNTLVQVQDPEPLLKGIVNQMLTTAGAAWASVILIDELGQARQLVLAGLDKEFDVEHLIRPGGISLQVMHTNKARGIPNTYLERDQVSPSMFENGVAAALCLPFTLQGKCIGVMWIHYNEPRTFPTFEVDALQLYASHAATAYDKACRMREVERMRRAAAAMAGSLGLKGVLQTIAESAQEVLQAHSAIIWPYDGSRNEFLLDELVPIGISPEEMSKFRRAEGKPGSTAEWVLRESYVAVTDVSDPQYSFLGKTTRRLLEHMGVRSFQATVLKVGEEVLGILYVNYPPPRHFSEEGRQPLEAFASHAALALKSTRLLEQVQRTRQAASAVAQLVVREDLQQTLDLAVRSIHETLGCDTVVLYSYNNETGLMEARAVSGASPSSSLLPEQLKPDSTVWRALELPAPHIVEEQAEEDRLMRGRFVRAESIRAGVVTALRAGGCSVGVMFVNYRHPHRFTEDERATLNLFADQAAVAIRNAQLYREGRRRAKMLEALYEASRAVTSTLRLQEILQHIAEQSLRLVGEQEEPGCFSNIALVDEERLESTAACPLRILPNLRRTVSAVEKNRGTWTGIMRRAIRAGKTQNVGDVRSDPDYIEFDPQTRSELAVPIKVGAEVIGVINVEHVAQNAFSKDDEQALESLAAQAAISIQNARHKGLVGAATATEWMKMVSLLWGHNIGREVSTALGMVQLLEKQGRGEELEQLRAILTGIQEIPITAPLSSEAEYVRQVKVNALVEALFASLRIRYQQVKFSLELQPGLDQVAFVPASSEWLRRLLELLVDNAVYAMITANSPSKEVVVTTRFKGDAVELLISDTGPGIPRQYLENLFTKRIEKPAGSRGVGFGLVLAATIVQTYRGTIRLERTGDEGTTILISLPAEATTNPANNGAAVAG